VTGLIGALVGFFVGLGVSSDKVGLDDGLKVGYPSLFHASPEEKRK
jgi:hypothetical protein